MPLGQLTPGLLPAEKASRAPRQVKFAVQRKHGVWYGTIVLPVGMFAAPGTPAMKTGVMKYATTVPRAETTVTAKGTTKQSALAAASGLAKQIANNPIVSAALPPGTGAAINAIDMLAKSGAAGALESGLKKLTGEGAKRIASALKFW